MNPTDPLAQLHPLRDPAAIGWWPPAPGWWLLAGLAVVALGTLCWLGMRQHRRNAYRRQGLAELERIRSRWQTDGDHLACLTAVNALLKAVALVAYPRREIAGISGRDWQVFLDEATTGTDQFELRLLQAQYLREIDHEGLDEHLARCARWIRRHKVSR